MEKLPAELVYTILASELDLETLTNVSLMNQTLHNQATHIMNPKITYYLSGEIQSKTWYDKQGNMRTITYRKKVKHGEIKMEKDIGRMALLINLGMKMVTNIWKAGI